MRIELEDELAEKYAFMKKGRSLEDQHKSGCIDDLYSAFGCECADGWYGLLDEMCAKIQAVYDENGSEPDIIIDQIKEKYVRNVVNPEKPEIWHTYRRFVMSVIQKLKISSI